MYQFFVESGQIQENRIIITGADVNHIRNVLRMKPGEHIRVSDGGGRDYFCRIAELSEAAVWAEIDGADESGTELSSRVYLFQGLPKQEKMELVIQKSVELGVCGVIPVEMKNCVVKLDEKKAKGKVARWQAIAESAAKQSKRSIIPQVEMPVSYKEAIRRLKELDAALIPYENERGMEATREVFSGMKKGKTIGILIGPEGGFSDEEIALIPEGMHRISLGRRILRTETAGPAALAMLVYVLDE